MVRHFRLATPHVQFALESISKVFTAALAMEQVGSREFHRKVGADPTGMAFNSVLALELHNDKPNVADGQRGGDDGNQLGVGHRR